MIPSPARTARFAIIAATVLVGTSAGAQTERRTLSGSTIAVYNIVGHVEVVPGTGNDVVVEVTRGGSDGRRLTVEVGDVRGRNALRVIYPDDDVVYDDLNRWSNSEFRVNSDGTWGDDNGGRHWSGGHRVRVKGSGSGVHAWANLRILVPSGKHAEIYLGVGELSADRVHADLRLDVASARVRTTGTRGNLRVDAGSGGADIRDASGDDIDIDTGSGGVAVSGITGKRLKFDTGSGGMSGSDLSAEDLDIDVGSGSIRVDGAKAERVKLDAGSGGVNFRFTNSPRDIKVDAGSGGVTMALPASLGAEVDVKTGSGGIDTDFAVRTTRYERHHLRGTIGDGAGRINIEAGSGTVRLRKA